jgi:hypothetical protein
MVWYLAPRKVPGKPGKITKGWTGPWKIVRQATDVHYDITPVSPVPRVTKVTAHVGRLRPYTGDITANQIPTDIQEDEDGDEDATAIPVDLWKWLRLPGAQVENTGNVWQREPGGRRGKCGRVLREQELPDASFLGSRGGRDQPPLSSL